MIICICILVANTGNYGLRFFVETIATSKKFNLYKIYPFPFTIACASFVNIIDDANYLNRKNVFEAKMRWPKMESIIDISYKIYFYQFNFFHVFKY